MTWQMVIGLEIHTQLATNSKIFSGASTAYGAAPNTQASAVDLAMPGTLPVLNKEAVELALRFGLSIGAHIAPYSIFARKNYFYPDLPKGYQISQFEHPIVGRGEIDITLSEGRTKCIGITRAHLEEDAGKSIHEGLNGKTGVDLNRAGTPLLEIVSEPDMRSAGEAVAYAKAIYERVTFLKICDGNMQEGSFRMDVNISLMPKGSDTLGTRAEIKNLNSFRFMEAAIAHEFDRQKKILESGGTVLQETRLYNPDLDETRSMRSKEDAHDYRYFPDPDLLPVTIDPALLERIKNELPEMPQCKLERYQNKLGLGEQEAQKISSDIDLANFFEATLRTNNILSPKQVANTLVGDLSALINKHNSSITASTISPEIFSTVLLRIQENTISKSAAKTVLETLWDSDQSVDDIITNKGLAQMSDTGELEKIIDAIIADNPSQVEQYRAGKDKLIAFFVGQVMKATKGSADPAVVNELLKQKL